jgi:hypothetical protein
MKLLNWPLYLTIYYKLGRYILIIYNQFGFYILPFIVIYSLKIRSSVGMDNLFIDFLKGRVFTCSI